MEMNLSKIHEMVKGRGAWNAAVHTKLSIENNTADRGGARKEGYVASTVESVLDQL